MTTYYVTKYALTAGILKVEGVVGSGETMLVFKRKDSTYREYVHDKDFHSTLEAANLRAEEMRQKRITSTEKSLDKLRKMGVYKVVDCQ